MVCWTSLASWMQTRGRRLRRLFPTSAATGTREMTRCAGRGRGAAVEGWLGGFVSPGTSHPKTAPLLAVAALLVSHVAWTASLASAADGSGTTCWQKWAFYQASNPGLTETLGWGTRFSAPCVLDAYLTIERAAIEFAVERFTDTVVRIAACESPLQPAMVGRTDPADIGLFQWNDKPPWRWWTTARRVATTPRWAVRADLR